MSLVLWNLEQKSFSSRKSLKSRSKWTLDKKYSDGYAGQAEKYTKVMVSMINDVIKNTPNAFLTPAPPKTVSAAPKTTASSGSKKKEKN